MRAVSATTLDSVLLLNRGDHFEVRLLPPEAQFSPAFGLAVGDLDGDGNEDLFIAQNFFGVSSAESRQDAGSGLWLKGDGRGHLRAVPVLESGLALYGEGRGAALSDYDHDGRLDLVVTQNRGATILFHNRGAVPGLRVHLTGLAGNPQAVGAQVRCIFTGGRVGPMHELHVGAGYWSQDSTEAIFGLPETPASLEIRWPGGITETVPIPPGARVIAPQHPRPDGP